MQRETLTQNDFTTSTNWGIANGVSIVSQKAEYNHHASGGTLTQTEANFSDVTGSDNNPATGDILYIFKYTVASVTDTNNDLSLRITTGFAEEVVPLNVTAGSYTAYFKANSDPGSFVLEVEASGSDNGDTFTLDDLSLKPLESGKLVVGGETVLDGSLEMPHGSAPTIDAEGEIAIDSTNTTASDLVYYSGGEAQVLNPLQVKTVVVAQPADTDQILLMRAPYDLTIQNIHGINDPQDAAGETVLFRIFETESDGDYDIPAAGSDGKDIDAVTSDDVGVDATPTGTDGKVTAGNWIGIYVETVTNTVDFLTVTFEYTKDRE